MRYLSQTEATKLSSAEQADLIAVRKARDLQFDEEAAAEGTASALAFRPSRFSNKKKGGVTLNAVIRQGDHATDRVQQGMDNYVAQMESWGEWWEKRLS